MNASYRLLFAIALVSLTAGVTDAWAKGGKVTGWSGTAAGAGSGSDANAASVNSMLTNASKTKGDSVHGYAPPASIGMSGMLMTPNGMIVHDTPAMAAATATNMGGSTMVGRRARGIGNSTIGPLARGIGNSQGSGGTMDIAQMTHFGISSLSALGSMMGGSGISSLSNLLSSSKSMANPGGGASGSANTTMKTQVMGMPVNKACVSSAGSKAGCG